MVTVTGSNYIVFKDAETGAEFGFNPVWSSNAGMFYAKRSTSDEIRYFKVDKYST